jgi:hypothetical protein
MICTSSPLEDNTGSIDGTHSSALLQLLKAIETAMKIGSLF